MKKRGKEGRREGRKGEERKILTPDSYMGFGYRKDLKEFTELLHSQSESEVTQSCLTLSHPMACSLPGSSVHGISQARILEWVAFSSSNAAK